VKGKLANGVGSQYASHYLGTWCIQHYYRSYAHLGCQQSTELTSPGDLKGLFRFGERRNLVSARATSHFKGSLSILGIVLLSCRSLQWPRGLRSRSSAARLLRLWVRIPLGSWMFVCCECNVLSGRGLCDGLITRPKESYRM
jgi:hypothetical protein